MAQRARKPQDRHHALFQTWMQTTAARAMGAKPDVPALAVLREVNIHTPPENDKPVTTLMDDVESPPEGMSHLRWIAVCAMRTWQFADHKLQQAIRHNNELHAAHYTRLMPQLHATVQNAEKAALEHEQAIKHLIPAGDLDDATRTVIIPLGQTVSNLRSEIISIVNENFTALRNLWVAEWCFASDKPTAEKIIDSRLADVIAILAQSVRQWQRDRYQPALENALTFLGAMGPQKMAA